MHPVRRSRRSSLLPACLCRRQCSRRGLVDRCRPGVRPARSKIRRRHCASQAAQKIDPSSIKTTLGGVKYFVAKEGSCPAADPMGVAGSCVPKEGSYCIIDYTGFLPDGTVFDTTERKGGKPLAFRLGERQVIVGLEQLVSQMKPGEEVEALVPFDLAYGDKGVCTGEGECLIPPKTNLKYFVRLIRTAPAAG